MSRGSWTAIMIGAVLATVLTAGTASASFLSLHFGILERNDFPCPLRPETATWAATDYPVAIVVQWGLTRRGDRRDIVVTAPNGRGFSNTVTWDADSARRCSPATVPILGTSAETWLGTWRVTVALNGRNVGEGSFEVVGARAGALSEYQQRLAASPASATAHFRVGATAALLGQHDLAERHLGEATRLSPTWWTPVLAQARLYLRAGDKDKTRERLVFLRGLLMGRRDDPGTMTALYKAMLEDLLKEVGE